MTKNIVILTGSGISAESGLKTFRDAGGLWEGHNVEDVATPEAFMRNPALVQKFYNQRRLQLKEARANAAHFALAELEQKWSGDFLLITQNVDNLHEQAGSKKLLHMHGELNKVRCQETEKIFDFTEEVLDNTKCSCCNQPNNLRPHIVWFGEMPLGMDFIYESLNKADIFISIGTSGIVYPAAGFVQEVRNIGRAETIEINLEPSAGHSLFEKKIYGPASKTVPELVNNLLKF